MFKNHKTNKADIKPITNITSVTNNDDDIDFPVWEEDDPLIAPTEIDQNKIILTDDGDIILTEPDNMQVEEKPFTRISEGVVALPPEENMEVIKTKSIVLKRKNPNNEIAKVKKRKNDTDVLVRDAVPIQHPIYRRLEKNLHKAKKEENKKQK